MSCLLAALSAAFYWLSHSHLMRQYHAQREAEVQSFRRQMSGLFAGISDRLVRLGGTIVSMENLVDDIQAWQPRQEFVGSDREARFASLGYEMDVQRIEFYTPGGERLWRWTPAEAPDLPEERLRAALAQVHARGTPGDLLVVRAALPLARLRTGPRRGAKTSGSWGSVNRSRIWSSSSGP